MSALFDSGMFVRRPAWHHQGNVVAEPPKDWAEFRRLAGLEWDPAVAPLFGQLTVNPDGQVVYAKEEGIQKVVRTDTGARIGVVGEGYHLINHHDMGKIAEALLAKDDVTIETGGSLDGGSKVWALFKLGDPIQVKGDPSLMLPFAALLNAHDGSGALKAIATTIRIVCMNTWHAAEADADSNGTVATIKHTSNWESRIEQARKALAGAKADADLLHEWFESLTGVTVSEAQLRKFTDKFFFPKEAAAMSDTVRAHVEESVGNFYSAYNSVTCEGIRGTAYGVVQALGEYLDYGRDAVGKTDERRRDTLTGRTLLSPERLKRKGILILGDVMGQKLVNA